MFRLSDFQHLPNLDPHIIQMISHPQGVMLVCGSGGSQSATIMDQVFLPGGRGTIFNVVLHEYAEIHPEAKIAIVSSERGFFRPPRSMSKRIAYFTEELPKRPIREQIRQAAIRHPDLLVIDRMTEETVIDAFHAAENGINVLSQLDCLAWGAETAGILLKLGLPKSSLKYITWVISVLRMSTLCPSCRVSTPVSRDTLLQFLRQEPELASTYELLSLNSGFFEPGSCHQCNRTGRSNSINIFDVFTKPYLEEFDGNKASVLPLTEYVLRMAAQGYFPFSDVISLRDHQLRYSNREGIQSSTNTRAKVDDQNQTGTSMRPELEAASRVLLQRTEALVAVQDFVQTLISSDDLQDLAAKVCRRVVERCGAERVLLYLVEKEEHEERLASILASQGWEPGMVDTVTLHRLRISHSRGENTYLGVPPGIRPEGYARLGVRAGLFIPLFAQDRPVGALIVQSSTKKEFSPSEIALLHTFANQAALAIQRQRLIEELRQKIQLLEQAQVELVKKERLEKELDLARQVQQSMLPLEYPEVEGYSFFATYRSARHVGGDFFDIFRLNDREIGLVIADVSDKGMPAALYMALTRSLLRAEAYRASSPKETLLNVNRLLLELGGGENFVSVFYGILDTQECQLRYARAGHDCPVLIRGGETKQLVGAGVALGILEIEPGQMEECSTNLMQGDHLILFTDGLMDVMNPKGQPYGLERLQNLFLTHADGLPRVISENILEVLASYQDSADQFDDMTLMIVKVD